MPLSQQGISWQACVTQPRLNSHEFGKQQCSFRKNNRLFLACVSWIASWLASRPLPVVRWIEVYLIERVSRMNVCGEISGTIPITNGVPKGSMMGPLLFLPFRERPHKCPRSTGAAVCGWCQHANHLERIQKLATRLVTGSCSLPYNDQLQWSFFISPHNTIFVWTPVSPKQHIVKKIIKVRLTENFLPWLTHFF